LEVPFPDMEAALKNHSVDAALVTEPFVTLAISHATVRVLEPSAHKALGEQFTIGSWFARKSWIDNNPEAAARFAKVIKKASEYINGHPAEVSKYLLSATKLTADLAEKITLPGFSSTLNPQDLQQTIDMAARYQFIAAPFDAWEILSKYAQ